MSTANAADLMVRHIDWLITVDSSRRVIRDAAVTVKFGPVKVTFRAKVALELDGTAMIGHVSSRGRDSQGGTRVKTAMTFKVMAGEAPGSSAVPIDAHVEISGRLASLVESGAALVVKRMTDEFTERLAARCIKGNA